MLRITHTQVAVGPHLLSDIDDGLPRRTAKSGVGDKSRSQTDGSTLSSATKATHHGANYDKQKCYVPRTKAGDATVAGYVDLIETDAVLLSQAQGVIKGLQRAGHITVTSFQPSSIVGPVLTLADLGTPSAGDLTLTGTGFLSLAPEVTKVTLSGAVSITLTSAQILLGGGTVTDTSIVIPAALIPGATITTTSAKVRADAQDSAVVVLT